MVDVLATDGAWTIDELRVEGYTWEELIFGGWQREELMVEGCTVEEMNAARKKKKKAKPS